MIIKMLSFSFGDLFSVVLGFTLGLSWGAYIFLKRKRKLILSHLSPKYDVLDSDIKANIDKCINDVYKYHVKVRKNKVKLFFGLINIKRKVNYEKLSMMYLRKYAGEEISLTKELYYLVEHVASLYYPNSKYPLLELNIGEVFVLLNNIIDEIEALFVSLGIPNIKQMRLKSIYEIFTFSNKFLKVYNMKGIKITISLVNMAIKLQSILTPIYWIKKGTNVVTTSSISGFLTKCMFEIVAKETAVIYKFDLDKNLESEEH